jgi:Putative MetA-pathway of phenol degradation
MMRRLSWVIVALSLSFLCPGIAAAQGDLAGLVKRVLDRATINQTTRNPNAPASTDCPQFSTDPTKCINHQPHFIVGESLKLTTREVNVAIAEQLSSFPLSSSSGGFSFSVDKDGAVVPASTTFGPAFAERGLTIGKGKFNVGFSFQATSYDSFEGIDLESGGLSFIREHNDCCPNNHNPPARTDFTPAFERDLLQSNLRLAIDTRTTAFFANYGVTNRLDIGIAIPISHVEMDATVDGRILRLGSGQTSEFHEFENGQAQESFLESGSATGLGDILLRGKFNFYRTESTALAAALDLRLPTGDKDNLLGTGATQANVFFVGSGEYGAFSPHVNIGYTFSNGNASEEATSFALDAATFGTVPDAVNSREVDLSIPDEFNYVAGVAIAVHPRVTVGFDFRGRNIRDVPRFGLENVSYPDRGPGTLPQPAYESTNEFSIESRDGNLNLLLGVLGAKINLGGAFLLNVSVLFPMTDDGLKPKPTPVIGFDYVF